jgi:hypothetical protein
LAGHQHDRRVVDLGIASNLAQDFCSTQAGQREIEQDHLRTMGAHLRDAIYTVYGASNGEALEREAHLVELAGVLLIFHDEDGRQRPIGQLAHVEGPHDGCPLLRSTRSSRHASPKSGGFALRSINEGTDG